MCQSLALTKEGWNLFSQKYRSKEQPQNKHRTLYRSLYLSNKRSRGSWLLLLILSRGLQTR